MTKIQIISFLVQFVVILGDIIFYAILLRIIMSWVSMGSFGFRGRFTQALNDITDPIINIAKKLPHRFGMFDFSPMIALFGVELLTRGIVILLSKLI